jgi:urease accessory protein
VTCNACRHDGERLFREKFVVEPQRVNLRNIGIMSGYDMYANVIVLTPPEMAEKIYQATTVGYDKEKHLATGITRLPHNAGLLYKVLGNEVPPVKTRIREFCSLVRQTVKGKPLQPDFPWR